ncbi:MAG: selenocysteine-specific translation elongation factor [Planctomycetes bacterium]|nr:selenocysteine-specific translation elongation factor [Planctomycetota bacterium]
MTSSPAPDKYESGSSNEDSARHFILGTAGHIDHGKTRLVKTLTGTDTDRLPEEQRRGMTIELGFAELSLGDVRFGVVDVPGHERFVRTMVAGATGIDLALIVVAADDSVMPQTREHVDILNLLGVRRAVVAVTKIDISGEDMVEFVIEDVRELLSGTPLKDVPICPVSSATGEGIDMLKKTISEQAASLVVSRTARPFRLAVDRVFTIQGRGTVVTGSALRGTVEAGDKLEVWPAGKACRVRALQTHSVDHSALSRGQRIAVNVSGISRDEMQRGSELATPGYLHGAHMLDVRVQLLKSAPRSLKSTSVVRLGIGTIEVPARIVLFGAKVLAPGESAYGQLRCGQRITATYGQRFIIRDESATQTMGGGMVLRPVARRRRQSEEREIEDLRNLENGDAVERVEQVLRFSGFTRPTDLQICARAGVELDEIPDLLARLRDERRYVSIDGTDVFAVPQALDDLADRLSSWLERYHRTHPDQPGRHADAVVGWLERITTKALARPLFDRLVRKKKMKPFGRFVCLPAFAPELTKGDEKFLKQVIDEIRTAEFAPPALYALACAKPADKKRLERLITLAVAMGELVPIDGKIYLHAESERQLRSHVAEQIAREGRVTVASVRESLDSSRKFVVPFLEYLDKVGFTKRVGDYRVLADAGRAEPEEAVKDSKST